MNNYVVSKAMRTIMLLFVHILVTFVRLLGHGCVKTVIADSLLLKHQLIVASYTRCKSLNLITTDRFFMGICLLFLHPSRISKSAVILKPSTLLSFYKALVKRNTICYSLQIGAVNLIAVDCFNYLRLHK